MKTFLSAADLSSKVVVHGHFVGLFHKRSGHFQSIASRYYVFEVASPFAIPWITQNLANQKLKSIRAQRFVDTYELAYSMMGDPGCNPIIDAG
jgi:hypothetical protein